MQTRLPIECKEQDRNKESMERNTGSRENHLVHEVSEYDKCS